MATTLVLNGAQSAVVCNLDTYNYTVQTTAAHVCKVSLSVLPPSGISIAIQLNGSNKATFSAPAASQEACDLSVTMACSSSDVISVVLSSSTASDQGKNDLKGIINIHVGSSN